MSTPSENNVITHHFHFTFEDSLTRTFTLRLDARTLALIQSPPETYPEWTLLTHRQCPNCPLSATECQHCPIAVNLIEPIDFFKDSVSYEKISIAIESERRTYQKQTSLQEGLSSLLSIPMVTSGCPIMDKLRPMLMSHLPFSTTAETRYRMLSMYLLAQYMRGRQGQQPDWELDGLKTFFKDIQIVNRHFWKRFVSANIKDASMNALVLLDNLAQYAAFSIDIGQLDDMQQLFAPFYK